MSYRKKHITPKLKHLKKKPPFFKKPLFWIGFGVLIIIVVGALLVFLPQFQIRNITVSGNETILTQDIENVMLANINNRGILNKNIFLFNVKNATKDILHAFPPIESIRLQKNYTQQGISLAIQERKPYAVFCKQNNDCFLLDKNGVIFEPSAREAQSMVITQPFDSSQGKQPDNHVFLGQQVVEKNIIEGIYKIEENLKNNFQIDIKQVLVSNPLIITTSENWQIYFDPTSNIDLQITKMNALLENQVTPEVRKNLQYIYLQYKDRAYYK